MSTRVCGNCSHRASIPLRTHIEVRCDVDNHEISGLDDTSMWCKKWAKGEPPKCEKDTEADRKMQRFVDYIMKKRQRRANNMVDQKPSVIRGTINGKAKYCRIPVRSKIYEQMQESGEFSAETILAMPHEKAVAVIDAIMADWFYWMRRAGEYFVQLTPQAEEGEA